MFGIKEKGKEKVKRFHNALREQLTPYLARIGERFRIAPRIRLANSWAKKHPKKLMFNYSAFAVLLLGITLLSDFTIPKETKDDTLGLNSIPSMSHRLQSLSNTEIQNDRIKHELEQLGQKGMQIYNELDSLLKHQVKTHEDSVRIITNYRILNDTFNKHGHEHQKD